MIFSPCSTACLRKMNKQDNKSTAKAVIAGAHDLNGFIGTYRERDAQNMEIGKRLRLLCRPFAVHPPTHLKNTITREVF